MDLLMKCASTFRYLMDYQYHFTLGRKGQIKEITLGFSDTDFHHLVGLHKLKDISIARENRSLIFRQILLGNITYDTLTKSKFLSDILCRLQTFPNLVTLLDQNQLVFRFNPKLYPCSSIKSEFLLKIGNNTTFNIAFLFLDRSEQDIYFCRSFFPLEKVDYTKGQMQYTLLKKEKINLVMGQSFLQYDRLTPKK